MTMKRRLSDQEVRQLARYWFRAQMMRDHVHELVDEYKPELSGLSKDNWWEFETYLQYWFGALFVLVEGFNKLAIRDAKVQRLFNAHMGLLKKSRHETYHFVLDPLHVDETLLKHDRLNWAEDLHDAIGDYIKKIVAVRRDVELFIEWRNQRADIR